MQKFVHLKELDTKLQLISAFAVDHVKGFIYVEAYLKTYRFICLCVFGSLFVTIVKS
jgi:hypothetical protein